MLEELGPDDAWIEVQVSHKARQKDPALPRTFQAWVLIYRRPGHAPQRLLTSLLDPIAYPAAEIDALYHERWEIELGYDEIKTELQEREETLRSQSSNAIAQEVWGLLLAYNLVRREMKAIADEAQVEPVRVSFVAALRLIRDEWLWCAVASPGAVPDLVCTTSRRLHLRRVEGSYLALQWGLTQYTLEGDLHSSSPAPVGQWTSKSRQLLVDTGISS